MGHRNSKQLIFLSTFYWRKANKQKKVSVRDRNKILLKLTSELHLKN